MPKANFISSIGAWGVLPFAAGGRTDWQSRSDDKGVEGTSPMMFDVLTSYRAPSTKRSLGNWAIYFYSCSMFQDAICFPIPLTFPWRFMPIQRKIYSTYSISASHRGSTLDFFLGWVLYVSAQNHHNKSAQNHPTEVPRSSLFARCGWKAWKFTWIGENRLEWFKKKWGESARM